MDVINNNSIISDYFMSCANKEEDKKVCRLITQKIHRKFSDVFTGARCLKGTFKLQLREGNHPYQIPSRRVACALQEPLKRELDRLQKIQVIGQLDADEMSEW